jgi:monoamine oxidase
MPSVRIEIIVQPHSFHMPRSLFAQLSRRYEPQSELDRRQFMKITLAASAELLISGPTLFAAKPRSGPSTRRVILIGGGLSGLACAYELMSAGCQVTLVESRNRVGGRVLTFHDLVSGKSVEGGGEYIGANHPTWIAYSKKFGLNLFEGGEDENANQPVILGGRVLGQKEAKAVFEEMKIANQHMTADAEKIDADEPWKSPDAVKLDLMTTAQWLREVAVSRQCKLAFASQLAANNGVALGRQSYLGNLAQVKGGGLDKYWTDSETYRCRGGNQLLALKFAHALGPRLRLETPVTSIHAKADRVTIHCANGETLEGDDIVLAVPPSVWRRIQFEPDLPRELHPAMGVVVKYISVVDSPFWEAEALGPDAATDGMVSMTWNATAGQPGKAAALLAFSGGPAAGICRKRWSQERDKAYKQELEKLYPNYSRHFIGSRFMDWPSDQWTQAGYSFPSPGQVTTVGPMLRSGLGRLHFAGEHTCYKFVGYMEGALNSGVTLAKRLIIREPKNAGSSE